MTASVLLALLCLVAALGVLALSPLPPRRALGGALVLGAAGLALLRQVPVAFALGALGLAFWRSGGAGARAAAQPRAGSTSAVTTEWLAMSLDHDTGAMDGEVVRGAHAGRRLSELDRPELQQLAEEIRHSGDDESLALLEAYRARHRGEEPGAETTTEPSGGEMTEEQAYRVLGLEPGADAEEVRAAYRRLIRKVHPDHGGTSALAAMINAARERLDPT
jgi:hypothetical protein